MNFESAIEQNYACRTSTIPTVGRSVMSHTKNVNFGGTTGKEVVNFFQPNFTGNIFKAGLGYSKFVQG